MKNHTIETLKQFKDRRILSYYSDGWEHDYGTVTIYEARNMLFDILDSIKIEGNSFILSERLENSQPRRLSYIVNIGGKRCYFFELDEEARAIKKLDSPSGFACDNESYQELPEMLLNEIQEAPITQLSIITRFVINQNREVLYDDCSIINMHGYR